MKTGIELIAAEQARVVSEEGYTPEHDDQHTHGELIQAACAYAGYSSTSSSENGLSIAVSWWPDAWDWEQFKPKDRITNLVHAGQLIAAEIDRLQRLNGAV